MDRKNFLCYNTLGQENNLYFHMCAAVCSSGRILANIFRRSEIGEYYETGEYYEISAYQALGLLVEFLWAVR